MLSDVKRELPKEASFLIVLLDPKARRIGGNMSVQMILLLWLILWLFNSHIAWVRADIKTVINSVVLIVLTIWLVWALVVMHQVIV